MAPFGSDRGYVLVTAAYNEEQCIADTISSVVNQELRPRRWVIVSDGSSDATDSIIRDYSASHDFILYLRNEQRKSDDFAAKSCAIRLGLSRLEGLEYDFLGILDADVYFAPTYFQSLLRSFHKDPQLGLAGGTILQLVDGVVVPREKDPNTVAGAVQMFRRECFAKAGGPPAMPHGGEDSVMEIRARMKGWRTRTIPELEVYHRGLVGDCWGGRTGFRFNRGRVNYTLGYHLLYQLQRAVSRIADPPYIVGSIVEMLGYCEGKLRYREPCVEPDVANFLRGEQLSRLRALLGNGRAG